MKRVDLIMAIVFAIVGAWVLWQATKLPTFSLFGPGPEFMPNVLGIILIALSGIQFFTTVRSREEFATVSMPSRRAIFDILLIIVALFLYTFLMEPIGYVIATFGYCLLMLIAMGRYRWYVGLGISLLITAVFYWSFVSLLAVPIPTGIFGA